MKWILVPPLFLSLSAGYLAEYYSPLMGEFTLEVQERFIYDLRGVCRQYAAIHTGNLPDGKTSNQALRQLFIVDASGEERVSGTQEGDIAKPDANTGTYDTGFLYALAPGRIFLNYIRGHLAGKTDPTMPLLFMQAISADGEIWVLSIAEEGATKKYPTTNGTVLQEQNGQQVDIFSEAYLKEKYGILPQDILKPEGPHRDITALAHQRKMEILRIEAAIILLIWLPFLIPHWIKHRRKPKPHPETPTPQA